MPSPIAKRSQLRRRILQRSLSHAEEKNKKTGTIRAVDLPPTQESTLEKEKEACGLTCLRQSISRRGSRWLMDTCLVPSISPNVGREAPVPKGIHTGEIQ